jgi:hypothetical protein
MKIDRTDEELGMRANGASLAEDEVYLDNTTAQLTEAAYRVALKRGGGGSWIELKLDLWNALIDAVHKCRQQRPGGSTGG